MGFLTGGVTAIRFAAPRPDPFGEDDVALLRRFGIAAERVEDASGVTCGWAGGAHERDGAFACEKNLRGDCLAFDFRVSSTRLPAARLKSQYQVELAALAEASGRPPTARMRREARESARDCVEQEAKDGRYTRHAVVPVVWHHRRGEVWFGSASASHADRFVALFRRTFGADLEPLTPATEAGDGVGVPTEWVRGVTPEEFAWTPAESRYWLGNEFALWLLYQSETAAYMADLKAEVMVARSLTLACPRGQGGVDTFTHEGPGRLPEVRRAVQAGKLPRSVGLSVVWANDLYEFTLKADRWAVTGGKVPKPEDEVESAAEREVQRLDAVAGLFAAWDGLYAAFLDRRSDPTLWAKTADKMKAWIGGSADRGAV